MQSESTPSLLAVWIGIACNLSTHHVSILDDGLRQPVQQSCGTAMTTSHRTMSSRRLLRSPCVHIPSVRSIRGCQISTTAKQIVRKWSQFSVSCASKRTQRHYRPRHQARCSPSHFCRRQQTARLQGTRTSARTCASKMRHAFKQRQTTRSLQAIGCTRVRIQNRTESSHPASPS